MNGLSKDTIAYNIGWDAGMYGLPFYQDCADEMGVGWHSAKARYPSPNKSDRFIRKWIQLRAGAYRRGKHFSEKVTPRYLRMINMGVCPIRLLEYTYATGGDNDWSVDRVDNDRGYERQNLVSMSKIVNSAKSDLSYEEIGALVKMRDHIPLLDYGDTLLLWGTISPFHRSDRDNFLNPDNYYMGWPIVPDAPLNSIMSVQIHLSMSISTRTRMPKFQTALIEMSRASGNRVLVKKLIKRLCKFQARSPSMFNLLFAEWANPVNIRIFQTWIQGLKPRYRNLLFGRSRSVTKQVNEAVLSDNLEKWALPH